MKKKKKKAGQLNVEFRKSLQFNWIIIDSPWPRPIKRSISNFISDLNWKRSQIEWNILKNKKNEQRNMAASRFAPHLEKCMGMGRNSSRLASRRIASATREAALVSDEDVDDDDWNGAGGADKRRRHVKKDKNSPRRKKWKNGAPDASNASVGYPLSSTSSSAGWNSIKFNWINLEMKWVNNCN